MELEGSSSPTWSNLNHLSVSREPSASASHPHHSVLHLSSSMPSAPPRRFPGDGFDYRRPVTSSNVIDLTSEDAGPSTVPRDSHRSSGRPARPPRFGREIIDVDEDDARPVATSPGSPEIQFVSSRPIGPGSRPTSPSIGRNNAEEDEVEFVSANPLPESRRRRNVELDFMFTMLDDVELQDRVPHLRAQVERRATAERDRRRVETRFNRRVADLRAGRAGQGPHAPPRRGRGHIHMGFLTPQLNFHAVGFDLGLDFGDSDEGPAPPPPTYNAPEKAPEGFTRSPQELDVLVCPNCGDDLCVGDSEQKRQVWIVKQCGHVRYLTSSFCMTNDANRSLGLLR